jgi:hypothetical protein
MGEVINVNGGNNMVDFDARILEVAKSYMAVFIDMVETMYPDGASDDQYSDAYLEYATKFGRMIGKAIDVL